MPEREEERLAPAQRHEDFRAGLRGEGPEGVRGRAHRLRLRPRPAPCSRVGAGRLVGAGHGGGPHRLEVDVLQGPPRHQVGEGGPPRGQEVRHGRGDGGGRHARGLHPVAARRGLGDHGPGPDGGRQGDDVERRGRPERDGRRGAASGPGGGREAVRRALQHDAAGGEDHDAVRHPLGLAQLVGGEDDADALLLQPGHHGAHGDAALGVDAGRRLVEEGHLGPADQGEGEGEPLLLAAREVAPGRGGDGAQADEVEQLVRRDGVGVVAGEEAQDAVRPEHGVDAAALEHDADAAAERGVVGDGVEPEDPRPRRRPGGGSPRASRRSTSCRRRSGRARPAPRPPRRSGRGRRPRPVSRRVRSAR